MVPVNLGSLNYSYPVHVEVRKEIYPSNLKSWSQAPQ